MIVQSFNATLSPNGFTNRNSQHSLRAKLSIFNTHIYATGTLLRIDRGPDQLIRSDPATFILKLAPDTFATELPDNQMHIIKLRNQTALISYDLANNVRAISKSYYDD